MPQSMPDMQEPPLTPQDAAATIRRITTWDEALRHRTAGLMWMTWAFISAGTFMASSLVGAVHHEMPPWIGFVWMPWAIPGILITFLLWRSVGAVLPRGAPALRTFAAYVGGFLAVTVGGVAVVVALDLPLYPPTMVLLGLGTATTVIGIAQSRPPRTGLIVAGIGLAMAGVAVWEATALNGAAFMEGVHQAALLNAPVAGLSLLLVGLPQYFR